MDGPEETREFFLSKIRKIEYDNGRLNITFFGQSSGSIGPAKPEDVYEYPSETLVVKMVKSMSKNGLRDPYLVGIVKPKEKQFVKAIINGKLQEHWRLPDYQDKIYVDL